MGESLSATKPRNSEADSRNSVNDERSCQEASLSCSNAISRSVGRYKSLHGLAEISSTADFARSVT